MDYVSFLKFLSQNFDFGCGFSIFACLSQAFNLLGLLFLFSLGLKFLHFKGLIKFLCRFRGKSSNLRNGFFFKCGFDRTYNSKIISSKRGLLKFSRNSEPRVFDILEDIKEIVNECEVVSDEDSDSDCNELECSDEDEEFDIVALRKLIKIENQRPSVFDILEETKEIVNGCEVVSDVDSDSDRNEQECVDEDEEFDIVALRKLIKSERQRANSAFSELDKERISAATAAEEAMAMILRLQTEKSLIEMEANQYRRLAEEKQLYDQEVIRSLLSIIEQHETEMSLYEDHLRSHGQDSELCMKDDEGVDHCEGVGEYLGLIDPNNEDCIDYWELAT